MSSLVFADFPAATKAEGVGIGALAAAIAFVFFLEWGTGLATDDYIHLLDALQWHLAEHWWPKEYVSIPVLHYTHGLAFYFLGDRPWAYDLLKAVYAGAGVYFTSRFFSLFCGPRRALLLAFIFVLFPLHDGADYSLTEQYLVISFTSYLYAYALGARGNVCAAVVFALIASFASYGSPPIAIGLALLAVLRGDRKLAIAVYIPNLIYVVYYLTTSLFFKFGTARLIGDFSLLGLTREMLLEVMTFVDAAVGPSAWAKIFYSIASLDVLMGLIALAAAVGSLFYIAAERRGVAHRGLALAAGLIVVLSFGMFTLTGLYPQIDFGLGDRVMIYGDFLLVCLFASLRVPRVAEAAVIVVVFLAICGIDTHWKQWMGEVDRVGADIRANPQIRDIPKGDRLYVAGHQYSRLGPFAHIDFFTANYVVRAFFEMQFGQPLPFNVMSFNRRLEFKDGELHDRKFGGATPVSGAILLYDSDRNRVERLPAADIQARIDALPDENRHWTQELPDGWLKNLIVQFAPRLRYAY